MLLDKLATNSPSLLQVKNLAASCEASIQNNSNYNGCLCNCL